MFTDNSQQPVSVTQSHKHDDDFALGLTEVTYTATDATGNNSTCVIEIIVQGMLIMYTYIVLLRHMNIQRNSFDNTKYYDHINATGKWPIHAGEMPKAKGKASSSNTNITLEVISLSFDLIVGCVGSETINIDLEKCITALENDCYRRLLQVHHTRIRVRWFRHVSE